jgi:hypothetical protein
MSRKEVPRPGLLKAALAGKTPCFAHQEVHLSLRPTPPGLEIRDDLLWGRADRHGHHDDGRWRSGHR